MQKPLPTVVVCGNVTLDRAPGGFVPGGPAYYAGQAWRAMGADVRVLTSAAPAYPLSALEGTAAHLVPAADTTVFDNRYGADGVRTQRVEAQAAQLDPAFLPEDWRAPDVLHLVPVLSEVDPAAFRAGTRPRITGLCAQGLLRVVDSTGAVLQPPWTPPPALLAAVDVVILSEDDLRGQGGLLERLVRSVRVVAFTHGALGCDVIVGGRTTRVGVFPVEEVDPTGAGDVFAAGLLYAMAQGADPVEAARLGAGAASFVVEARGGEALPLVKGAFARAAQVPAPHPAGAADQGREAGGLPLSPRR
jgi:1D-myo-inositol 3-kinase